VTGTVPTISDTLESDTAGADGMRPVRVVTAVVIGLQLMALAAYSAYLFHRFDLTDDYGTYSQAWWLIGHGHFDPIDTIQTPSYPFWRSHFELGMWPVALLSRIWPNPIQLLWLQDAAMAATEWLVMAWVIRICRERIPRIRIAMAASLVALAVLVSNPWWYQAASFDVHFELLGLPFVVWSAYGLWRGRARTCLVTAGLAVLFGDVVTVTILCAALAGLLSRRARHARGVRTSLVVVGASVVWLGLVTLVGGNRGSGIVANYGYLVAARPTASSASVMTRLMLHPWHAIEVLFDRRAGMGRVIASAGLLGVVTPWGIVVALGTLGPAALNSNRAFLSPTIAFQTMAVVPFVFVGTVMVLVRIGTRAGGHSSGRRTGPALAISLAIGLCSLGIAQGVPLLRALPGQWWRVDAPTAAVLRSELPSIPGDAEVIVSQGVIGRFADRRYVYPLLASPQAFPVRSRLVMMVIVPTEGLESIPPAAARATISAARDRLHAVTVVDRHGVVVLIWHPPPGVGTVVLP
jgi:uncharacterized membrane protein